MKTLKITLGIALLTAGISTFTSCEKSRLNKATTTSEDNNLAEVGFNDVLKVTEDALKEEDLEGRAPGAFAQLYSGCATVTVTPADTITWPKTITVDFGTANCTGSDLRTRRGKIIITATGFYREAGTVLTITTDNYYVNDYKVEGTKTITNNGRNTGGNLSYSVVVAGGKITTPDGDIIEWESTRTREWIEGESTTFLSHGLSGILDDVYSITGNANGTNREGRDFTANITSPLRVELDCRWITQGTVEVQPEDLKLRTVDFGAGSCDNEATITIDNRTYTIYMR
jgi:hypothetical protein